MPTRPADAPLIVTAHLDDAAFAVFDALRRRHFPARLNKIPAHVSLFHALPGDRLDTLVATVTDLCARQNSFDLEPLAPRFLGRGVALAYRAEALDALRGRIARRFTDVLSAQDREPFRAHVTIQNKVDPATARALMETVAAWDPPVPRVEGIDLWRYLGGPWEAIETVRFADVGRA